MVRPGLKSQEQLQNASMDCRDCFYFLFLYIFILRFGHCILILVSRKILWIVKTSYGLSTPLILDSIYNLIKYISY